MTLLHPRGAQRVASEKLFRLPRLRAAMVLLFGVMPGGIGIDGALDRIERMP